MSGLIDIPVIDLFAGPGGLGEGFSALRTPDGARVFRVLLSIEKDRHAHQTLLLRSFFRQFDDGQVPSAYYEYLRGEERWLGATVDDLLDEFPAEGRHAREEAWCEELRPDAEDLVDERISKALRRFGKKGEWVLIGGPPCQAYSLVGRARMLGTMGDRFFEDRRHTLYREYLRIIAKHRPSVFVMENVTGLLSATSRDGNLIFRQILRDLQRPAGTRMRYRLFPLSCEPGTPCDDSRSPPDPQDFVVRCEDHGIPQARHRIIIVGVLEDQYGSDLRIPFSLPRNNDRVTCRKAIGDLSRLRSGVSRTSDSPTLWHSIIRAAPDTSWFRQIRSNGQGDVADRIYNTLRHICTPRKGRGGRFVPGTPKPGFEAAWFFDSRLEGFCNHETRAHRQDDLHRYLYVACFGRQRAASPKLDDFPADLLPRHKNAMKAIQSGIFTDRFTVQLAGRPSRTITAHISKDGHAFIHYDPTQCRSLTVREAARLQTFPDNYFFEGPRTEQYRQVGNAVPPLLARDIASIVAAGLASGWR